MVGPRRRVRFLGGRARRGRGWLRGRAGLWASRAAWLVVSGVASLLGVGSAGGLQLGGPLDDQPTRRLSRADLLPFGGTPCVVVPVHDHGNIFAEWICQMFEQLSPAGTTLNVLEGARPISV